MPKENQRGAFIRSAVTEPLEPFHRPFEEYAPGKLARSKLPESKSKTLVKSGRERVFDLRSRWTASLSGSWSSKERGGGGGEGEQNGQLGSADSGILPGAPGRHRLDHRHHHAPVEDVRLRRGQHHHRGGHVPGTVDVLRLAEHRTDPV